MNNKLMMVKDNFGADSRLGIVGNMTRAALISSLLLIIAAGNSFADDSSISESAQNSNYQRIILAQATEVSGEVETDSQGNDLDDESDSLARWHDIVSDKIESMGESADRLFDPGIVFEEINQTSIRLRLDSDFVEGESTEFDAKIDVKLVLPAADGRLRLLASSDDTPNEGGGQLGDPLGSDDEDRASAALDFSVRDDEKWRLSLSLGARSDQLYSRFKLRRNFEMGDRWKSRILNRLTYFSDDGYQNDFRIDFDRTLGRPLPDTTEFRELAVGGDRRQWLFRSASRYLVNEDKESDLYEQRFSLFNRLSRYSAIAYEALAYGCTNPNTLDETIDCQEYDLRVRYKWVLPKYNWIAFELWPVAAFPESNDFDVEAQLRFRMEIWFGHGKRAQGGEGVSL
jgi:hypothetical protein